ncbi:MAG: DNA primase, partial [Candidatus Omnitrophota bacterium]|nr:DNA primase [Candidatus Omnitrophota bacterium]
MAPLIPDNILDQIVDRCDIAEVISDYIPLKRAGRSYKALCPFHHEKTPSFIVNPEKGIFHCFGCGVGGNVYGFIMKYERLEFLEAVRMLAKRSGVTLPEGSLAEGAETSSLVNGIYKVHEFAIAYFQNTLMAPSGKTAKEYLAGRGVKSETISKFRLGFAPGSWDSLFTYLKRKGFNEEIIGKSGLCIRRPDKSGYYDRFRNRLIFPIFSQNGRPIAFAGRVLDETLPKYVNSPETLIYNKSRTLFGLNFTKGDISGKDEAVIVEGYMDLIVPYQSGVKNLIASCGTALTAEQIRLLRRYSRNVIIAYDSDKAGEIATLRSMGLLLTDDMNVKIARLPEKLDPDSFVRKHGAGSLGRILGEADNLFEYKLNLLLSKHKTGGLESKAMVAGEMLNTISKVNNAVLRAAYIKKLAESLGFSEDDIRTELKKVKKQRDLNYNTRAVSFNKKTDALSAADKIIIRLMIENNDIIRAVKKEL